MYALRPVEDPARHWQRFCRAGIHLAAAFALLWFGGLALLFRVAPAPKPLPHASPLPVSWWPAQDGAPPDIRAMWSPALFALPSPAGFSHALRNERIRLAPPVQSAVAAPAYLDPPRNPGGLEWLQPGRLALADAAAGPRVTKTTGVFPPRMPVPDLPRMEFSAGWESRLFSGIDRNHGTWTNVAWTARIEMLFDPNGVPVSMLLAQPSGLPDVDRLLTRSAYGWRLLEPEAPRAGTVSWSSPAAATPEEP